ncbi:LAME_0C04214g1_1 [Lachancea meyersii CBS 8951]|uniref:ATPase expression protein 1 n=1 Tax=Lachancea meyersii CBS 8951 TaxID=1266667 RepID=A0A1G4J0T2_9SACH|nr:LAME_0C04214g1_1 [Lachancea meyersii CBS 8951]
MGYRNVSSRRLYSTLKETIRIKSAHGNIDGESWKGLQRVVPAYSDTIHPFYGPNVAERAILSSTEDCPVLLDGCKIVPAIIKHPRDHTPTLVNGRWIFKSGHGVSKWLEDFRAVEAANGTPFAVIEDRDVEQILRPSRLNPSQFPDLQKFAELYRQQDAAAPDSVLISGLIESLTSLPVIKVFSEEVFLYILQHYCSSKHGVVGVAHSIVQFLHKDIDDIKVAELLVLQLLVTIKKNQIAADSQVPKAVFELIRAISERFNKQNCVTDFSPATTQVVLELYLDSGSLNEAKVLFAHLINQHICPQSILLEKYLLLVDEKFGSAGSSDDLLKKFAYISDVKRILETAITPTSASLLIPYCRHFDEVISLLDIISHSKMMKQIWDHTLPQLIRRVSLLGDDVEVNSCNLSILLQRAQQLYGETLSNKVLQAFIVQFAVNGNFTMVSNLISRLEGTISANFSASILDTSFYKQNQSSLPGFSSHDKREFIKNEVFPRYKELSAAGKILVLNSADTEEIFEPLLRIESQNEKNGKKSILHDAIHKAESYGFHSLIEKYSH